MGAIITPLLCWPTRGAPTNQLAVSRVADWSTCGQLAEKFDLNFAQNNCFKCDMLYRLKLHYIEHFKYSIGLVLVLDSCLVYKYITILYKKRRCWRVDQSATRLTASWSVGELYSKRVNK